MRTPRVFTTGRGYEEIRRPGRSGVSDGVKHHRLLAFAWGKIDSLDERLEIDHRVEVRWMNLESNLKAVEVTDHRRRTRHRSQERRRDPEGYAAEDLEEVIPA